LTGWAALSVWGDFLLGFLTDVAYLFCIAEIEAAEACKWLRAAGFPQYAQMYEGEHYKAFRAQADWM
jgi:hypothetical protein